MLDMPTAVTLPALAALLAGAAWPLLARRRRGMEERQRLQQLADAAVEGLLVCQGDVIVSVRPVDIRAQVIQVSQLAVAEHRDRHIRGLRFRVVRIQREFLRGNAMGIASLVELFNEVACVPAKRMALRGPESERMAVGN